jgi:SAM-dependent methyltransferase
MPHEGRELARDAAGHAVIDCESCDFAHYWPKPTVDELRGYYARAFYETHVPPDWAEKEAAEEPYWQIEHHDRIDAFAEWLGQPTGRLLDVGCGGGWLLAHARERGWDVLGIEPSRHMWRRAVTRAPVLHGTFDDIDLTGRGPFDAVHLKLVLEHVADPPRFLEGVRAAVRPGGVVCVEVPNDFNALQQAVRVCLDKPAWWLSYPAHINYFTFDSLERLLARTGLRPVLREATYPMELFLLQGLDYIGRDELGRRCHEQRMRLEQNLERAGLGDLRRCLAHWLALNDIGRDAVVYAIRD